MYNEKEFDIMGNMYEAPFLQMLEEHFNELKESNKCIGSKLDDIKSRLIVLETNQKHNVTFEDCGRRKEDLPNLIRQEAQPMIDSSIKSSLLKVIKVSAGIVATIIIMMVGIIGYFIRDHVIAEVPKSASIQQVKK
jgi:hypothetical protein